MQRQDPEPMTIPTKCINCGGRVVKGADGEPVCSFCGCSPMIRRQLDRPEVKPWERRQYNRSAPYPKRKKGQHGPY